MKNYPVLKFQLLSENAIAPTRGTSGSSGLDVFSPVDVTIPGRGDALIPLDIRFDIPYGWDLSAYNKSGICTKKKLSNGAELIDSDYRGSVHIHFFNNSDVDVHIKKGDKISQLVMREVWMGEMEQVDNISVKTERGQGGFGSTDGMKAEAKQRCMWGILVDTVNHWGVVDLNAIPIGEREALVGMNRYDTEKEAARWARDLNQHNEMPINWNKDEERL